MAKNIDVYNLLEVYGPLLTEKQRIVLEYYYFDDLSLSEIAENEGGSRQGAQNIIKRVERELLRFEEVLGNVKRSKTQLELLDRLKAECNGSQELILNELYETL